jgi:hypothetical protein
MLNRRWFPPSPSPDGRQQASKYHEERKSDVCFLRSIILIRAKGYHLRVINDESENNHSAALFLGICEI